MTLKPETITAAQVAEQTHTMSQQMIQLDLQIKTLTQMLGNIERSKLESDSLKQKIQELIATSIKNFQTEWSNKTDFYPELRKDILEKTVEMLSPSDKK